MKIKRLEIIGFKSFVDKVLFDFPEGITAIVGPNGCGKSNVVDAIRWVMGEQSAKNLRGRSMEDVIFGGSETRKPLGMAEVSLVFSTDDGRVPAKYLNYTEIQVTRRLYRDGESEYFLNKTPCRLMDIHELFMDTGVGAKAYSVIEQGRIGMILLAKPEDRRFLIEEAAGVTKFKARKQVALKKIDLTRQNLTRIGDIIAEIRRQLNSLHRQAKKAERFRAYREELKGIELHFGRKTYANLMATGKQAEADIVGLTSELDAVSVDAEKAGVLLEERKIAVLEDEKSLTAAQEDIFRIKGAAQTAENRIEFQKRELANLERHHERLTDELASLGRQREEASNELISLDEKKIAFESEAVAEDNVLRAKEAELGELTGKEQALASEIEDRRKDLFSLMSQVSQYNNQKSAAVKRLEILAERKERNDREGQGLRGRLEDAKTKSLELECQLSTDTDVKAALISAVEDLVRRQEHLRAAFEQQERQLAATREERSRKSSRLHSLQELEAQRAGYGQGVRALLLSERYKSLFPSILADVVETRPEYEAALEAVLGERLQFLVGGGEVDALSAVAHLKETAAGRCSFLLASSDLGASHPSPDDAPALLPHVFIGGAFRPLVEPLLNGVHVAADLPSAAQLSRRFPHLTFVTRDGDMAFGGGNIHGGSAEAVQEGLIHKKREIRELTQEVQTLTETVRRLEGEKGETKAAITVVEDGLREKRQAIHQAEIRLVNDEKDLLRMREECHRIEERLAVKELEDRQIVEEKAVLEKELQEAETGKAAAEEKKLHLEGSIEALHQKLSSLKDSMAALRDTVTAMKVRAAALREKRESNVRGIKRVEQLIRDLQARIEGHHLDLEKGGQERQMLTEALSAEEEGLRVLLSTQQEAESRLIQARERYEGGATSLREEEERLRKLRDGAEELRRKVGERNLVVSETTLKMRHMEESLRDKFRLDPPTLLEESEGDFDEAERMQRQAELQALVDDLGEVNLTAIEEYQELETRYNFLTEQRSDLEESLSGLQKAIQRINRTTRKRFLETFELVNAKFMEVFPRLFCGGKAELRLTNEDDLLETGIEIIVQPPGKKLQNVALLSGGEKALTAVALIFSIFLIKPSPFCLLDEVDAPLDDANIGRFNEMVKEMTSFSQFIMITHSKTTMMVADTLYGVTMEEPGVSKLVSVRLNG